MPFWCAAAAAMPADAYFCCMQQTWFQQWFNSPYYQILYQNRNAEEAKKFITRLLAHLAPGAGARMLDVACGSGRHARIMAEAGLEVTGIDLSERFIAEARTHEADNLHFFTHDMRLPYASNYFEVVFNLFTSFGYFAALRENLSALETMAGALKPGSTLVMDYLNTRFNAAHLLPYSRFDTGPVCFDLHRYQNDQFFFKDIFIRDKQSGENFHFREEVTKFVRTDFELMFNHFGLTLAETFGNYDLSPFNETASPRLIMIAKKTDTHA